MDNHLPNTDRSPAVMELWRKPGVDFDCCGKSSLAELLSLGGYFPLSKVEDRLPFSRSRLQQLSRGSVDGDLPSCFIPIRARGKGRAITILVDLVRLNNLLAAQVQGRNPGRSADITTLGASPTSLPEPQ